MNRREVLAGAAAVCVGAKAGWASGRAPSNTIVVAVMGTNGRGCDLARGFARQQGSQVAAICDVDQRAVAKGIKAAVEGGPKTPRGESDIRRVLDDKSIDVLAIAAPDHWHAPAAILACAAGKHVYVEKPCSHNAREGEQLVEAARKHKRVVQMGNQRRSWTGMIEAIQKLKDGAIGRVTFSRGWYTNLRGPIGKGKTGEPPAWLDYELWQGPAPRRPYRDNIIHYNWHWFWHWGTGEIGNNGVHGIDVCRWGLGVDYPLRVSSGGGRYVYDDDQETPDSHVVTFEFEGRRMLTWEGFSCNKRGIEGSQFGMSYFGEKGSLVLTDSGYEIFDAGNKSVEKHAAAREDIDARHFENFLSAIRGEAKPNSEIGEGHKSTLLCHLGNIAHRTGRTLRCDPATGRILGDDEAMKLWGRDYEPGWAPAP
jgi:predicted dehydrogenase